MPDNSNRDERVPQASRFAPLAAHTYARLTGSSVARDTGSVAAEVPVALVYRKRTHAVVMATPADLEDLAVGFTLSESIVRGVGEIERIEVVHHANGIDVTIMIPESVVAKLADRARSMSVRTGCGLCGVEAIDDAVREPRAIASTLQIDASALWCAGKALDEHQPLNRETHAIHGAAFANSSGELKIVREDVGRHNALDKVLGALARSALDPRDGFLVVTSRASFELVQKAAVFGVPILAAVSRPTALAIRIADESGICLVGLLRGESANVYTHPARVSG